MLLARVVLDIPTNALNEPFTYAICQGPEFDYATKIPASAYSKIIKTKDNIERNVDFSSMDRKYGIEVGCIVVVPFGNTVKVGYCVDIVSDENLEDDIDPDKLKPVICSISKPYFDKYNVEMAKYISDKYLAPLVSCIKLFVPSGCRAKISRGNKGWYVNCSKVKPVNDYFLIKGKKFNNFRPKENAVKQKQIIDVLSDGPIKISELNAEFGSVSTSVKALCQKDVCEKIEVRKYRGVDTSAKLDYSLSAFGDNDGAHGAADADQGVQTSADADQGVQTSVITDKYAHSAKGAGQVTQNTPNFELNNDQVNALSAIKDAADKADGQVILVDGVTGSGKTEVYIRAISHVLKKGQNAIVLVPEISLTPQTVARFRARFADSVAVLHSRMSVGERFDQWELIKNENARVVVGARSALFSPMKNVGLIVIDEEHESSYKQDSAPRYVTRDCAVRYAKNMSATLVLGSATPSIESLYNCNALDSWTRVVLPKRTNNKPMPKIDVVDMGQEFKSGSSMLFSKPLRQAIVQELSAGNKVMLLHNRRGFANYMFCRDCGYIPYCNNCSTALTYHDRLHVDSFVQGQKVQGTKSMLSCHHCGYLHYPPTKCPNCGSVYIAKLGAGTQSVEDQLADIISDVNYQGSKPRIIRMDADTTRNKNGHQKCLEEFAMPGPAVLLGTQMIAKGLDFEDVSLVGVVLADTNLNLPDFRSAERTFDLISQVAGRAGRADVSGRVIVQTYNPESISIAAASKYDRNMFLSDELPKRKMLSYPPYANMTNVLVWGPDETTVKENAVELQKQIVDYKVNNCGDNWDVSDAIPCALGKIRGNFRYHIVIKTPLNIPISTYLKEVVVKFRSKGNVKITCDVDPYSLL